MKNYRTHYSLDRSLPNLRELVVWPGYTHLILLNCLLELPPSVWISVAYGDNHHQNAGRKQGNLDQFEKHVFTSSLPQETEGYRLLKVKGKDYGRCTFFLIFVGCVDTPCHTKARFCYLTCGITYSFNRLPPQRPKKSASRLHRQGGISKPAHQRFDFALT